MLGVILLVLLGLGFYAFIGLGTKAASELLLALMWLGIALSTVGSLLYSLFR